MGRPRKWNSDAERKRAYYWRKKAKEGKLPTRQVDAPLVVQKALQVSEPPDTFQPELIDTRQWSWTKWVRYFYGEEIEPYEQETFYSFDTDFRNTTNIPRQHGKTTRLVRRFVVRKLCETRFTPFDENIIYFSSSKTNIADFVVLVADDLDYNERLVENYGYLLEKESKEEIIKIKRQRMRSMRIKQTSYILNVNTRRHLFNHSLQAITLRGQIRGKGMTRTIVDDPVDVFHTSTPEHVRKLTKKIFTFLQAKLIPATHGNISLVGTRYDVRGHDIFTMLAEEMGGHIWKHIEKQAVYQYGSYHLKNLKEGEKLNPSHIIINDPKEWKILSVGAWEHRASLFRQLFNIKCTYLQALVYMKETMTNLYWEQEFQNNPILLGSELKPEWFHDYANLYYPGITYRWAVSVDPASGESEAADYSAFVLVGEWSNNFYIHDIVFGRWTPRQKLKKLESFIQHASQLLSIEKKIVHIKDIKLLIETVHGQRDFYQRVRDESFLIPKAISPSKRKEKKDRIRYGLGQEMENGKVYLSLNCRNRTQLQLELEGFPHSADDHIIDALDQGIYWLKTKKTDIKAGWF